VVKGKNVFAYDTQDCMISANGANGRLIVVKSVNNLIIVDTPDVLMICDKSQEQEVKQIVTDINLSLTRNTLRTSGKALGNENNHHQS
jgi:mannose-1-phosphate guanylyltransferase